MNAIRLIPFLLILIVACSESKEVKIPEDVIPRDKMVEVLTDMHLVEGAKMGRRIMGDTLNIDSYYNKIFEKYNIDKEKLDRSYAFYSEHPKLMDEMYDETIENLNEIEVTNKHSKEKTP